MASESGGRGDAKNPNTTATGFFYWTGGTWSEMVWNNPDLGLTMDGRSNVAPARRAVQRFMERNARTLVRGGVAITHGTRYAAHLLGAGGEDLPLQTLQDFGAYGNDPSPVSPPPDSAPRHQAW